ncbi:MAG: glycosyltransferase family 4 protein [Candidatus Parcubacteria bacterium]|nr:glycosyltransferase family 4 protein [Candidatus Parcubacteria bacterium]
MRILICTGIYPPDVGGPAYYARKLVDEFQRRGFETKVLNYKLEKKLPTGIRHFFYFLRVVFNLSGVDLIIALDSFSVGLPAVLAAKIFRKKIIVRLGGDFFWESYVERSGDLISLKNFYKENQLLSKKEKMIFKLSKFVLNDCSALVFSTIWQRDIFTTAYNLNPIKNYVIENFYGEKMTDSGFQEKNYIWAGRLIKLKNLENLKIAFTEAQKENKDIKLDIMEKISEEELARKMQNCYVVILPSISDVSPNFILGAIKANKPFILTKETGFYDKLKDVGLFVDPLDKNDIKEKIIFLADDHNYVEYKKRVKNFNFIHSWKHIADEFLNIYKKL